MGTDDRGDRNERKAVVLALAAVLFWSTVATGFKLGLERLEPFQLLFLGSSISLALFVGLALPGGWPRRHFRAGEGLIHGALNPLLYYGLLFHAYDRLPAQIVQPLNYTWAVVLALLAVPVLGQRLTRRTGSGIAVSYLGVAVLLSYGRLDALPDLDVMGILLALASTLVWAAYWLWNARSRTPPAPFMANSFLFATPALAWLCWAGPGLPALNPASLGFGAWVGLLEMGFSFLLWQRALRLTNHAGRLGQLIFLSPFLSLLWIEAVLGEQIRTTSWAGLFLIVVGLCITGRPASSEVPQTPSRGSPQRLTAR